MKTIKQFSNGLQVGKNNTGWCVTDGFQTDYLHFCPASSNFVMETNQLKIGQDISDFLNKWAYIHYCAYMAKKG